MGDCWEKFICSSLPARLMEDFPVSKAHLQPATSLLASWVVVIGQNSVLHWKGGRGWRRRRAKSNLVPKAFPFFFYRRFHCRRRRPCLSSLLCQHFVLAFLTNTRGNGVDCEQSRFFFRFSGRNARARERRSRETRETRAAARAISHARGHLPVSRFARRATEKDCS